MTYEAKLENCKISKIEKKMEYELDGGSRVKTCC